MIQRYIHYVWPNGADFDPATLHGWPKYAELLAQRVLVWKAKASDACVTNE